MLFNQYPYLNLNDFNLDYILKTLKSLSEQLENFISLNTIKYANPIQWNITKQYEANTVVIDANDGTAYLSVQAVPTGVAITNTDYWTPIFTLNLLSANQNITLRDDGSNVLATFASAIDDWLIWNNTLYKVTRAIAVNEAYVVGYNLTRYSVELFIKDYVNVLLTMIGDLDDLTTTDKTNIVNAINEVLTLVGGLSDDIIDKLGHIIYEDGTAPTSISDYCYSLKENTLSSDDYIINNGTIDGLKVNSTSNPAIYNNNKITNSEVSTTSSIAVDVDQDASHVQISDSNLKGTSYAMLVNGNANIESCRINNNVIEATTGDSVEINTPNNKSTQDASNVLINSNVLDVLDLTSTAAGNGFGMGFAKPVNNIAVGNISKHSRSGGLHIENNADKIIVSENIFDNCKTDGSQLGVGCSESPSIPGVNGLPAIVTNNVFKHRESERSNRGLYKIYDGNTDDSFGIYKNNLLVGFEAGISLLGTSSVYHSIDIDGCICKDCNVGIELGVNAKGEITIINCNKALKIRDNAHIDVVTISGVDGENVFETASAHYTFTCDKFKINKRGGFTANNMYSVLPIPTKFKGTIEIKSNFEDYLYDVIDNTITLTNAFLYGATLFTLVENDGYYAIKPNVNFTGSVEVIVKGYYLLAA